MCASKRKSPRRASPRLNLIYKWCHGPGLQPDAERCGFQVVSAGGDTAPYNGITTWRCPKCFSEYRIRLALQKGLTKYKKLVIS